LNTLKTYPPRADVRFGVVEGKAEVFYASQADKGDAQRLVKYLGSQVKEVPGQVSFKLARRGDVVEVHMAVKKELLNEVALEALRKDRKGIAANVFPGAVVEMHLCDELMNVIQVLKE